MVGLISRLVKKLLTLVADPKSSWNGLRWVGVVLAEDVVLELKIDDLKKTSSVKVLDRIAIFSILLLYCTYCTTKDDLVFNY